MSPTVCLSASTIGYPEGGGHQWVYLNWALGLRALGCRVVWLESVRPCNTPEQVAPGLQVLRARLEHLGLCDGVALCSSTDEPLPPEVVDLGLDHEVVAAADLLLNLRYATSPELVARFARTALVDIDPGLLQLWMDAGTIRVPPHDVYFTTGETVGTPDARFPDAGIEWHYTPPCVALDAWQRTETPEGAPFTTVSHWVMGEWMLDGDEVYANDKRDGFLPYLDLPRRTSQRLELALCLSPYDDGERESLLARGWGVREAHEVACSPFRYQRYVQASAGEFSCVKPSCLRLANAWISDRTLCYLASGKPAVVEHTGPSRLLPEAEGLLRFRTPDEAVKLLERVAADYAHHADCARALAERHFDARKVVSRVLERALP